MRDVEILSLGLRLGHGPDSFGFLGAGLVGVSQLAA